MFYNYYYDGSYLLWMIIAFLVSLYAQIKVKHAFNKYSKIGSCSGLSGRKSAEMVLNYGKVDSVTIGGVAGYFTDHYDSRTNHISLSDNVLNKTSVAAVGVAAHEAGHATQNFCGYTPLKIRQFLVPISQFGSNLAMPLVFMGLLLPVRYNFFVNLGIIFFALAVLFQVVTLPIEFDASKRALAALKATGKLNEEEIIGVRKVLSAAALTYVAATFTALISLLRLILISKRRKDF